MQKKTHTHTKKQIFPSTSLPLYMLIIFFLCVCFVGPVILPGITWNWDSLLNRLPCTIVPGEYYVSLKYEFHHSNIYYITSEHITTSRADLSRLASKLSKSSSSSNSDILASIETELNDADLLIRAGRVRSHAALVIYVAENNNDIATVKRGIEGMSVVDQSSSSATGVVTAAVAADVGLKDVIPLSEKLDDFITSFDSMAAPHLIDIPPKMRPVPPKPYIFDVAFNEIEYPGSDHDGDSGNIAPSPIGGKTGTGIGGFLSGIWGRGG